MCFDATVVLSCRWRWESKIRRLAKDVAAGTWFPWYSSPGGGGLSSRAGRRKLHHDHKPRLATVCYKLMLFYHYYSKCFDISLTDLSSEPEVKCSPYSRSSVSVDVIMRSLLRVSYETMTQIRTASTTIWNRPSEFYQRREPDGQHRYGCLSDRRNLVKSLEKSGLGKSCSLSRAMSAPHRQEGRTP